VSDVCLSRTLGLSREQRGLGRLKLAHVIRDSDITFKVKGQLAGGGSILWRPPAQLVSDVFHRTLESINPKLPLVTFVIFYFTNSTNVQRFLVIFDTQALLLVQAYKKKHL